MADKQSPGLQYAADQAEKYGDTKTQETVKKMQYPYATDKQGYTDTSLYPSDARVQRYKTQDKEAETKKKAIPGSYRRGGKVRRTGMAKVHKGEHVLTKAQQKKVALKRGK